MHGCREEGHDRHKRRGSERLLAILYQQLAGLSIGCKHRSHRLAGKFLSLRVKSH